MTATAPDDRVLPCENCGLAIVTPIAGGTAACPRCNAPFAAYARPDTAVPPSPPTDETARRARLRLQDGKPMLPPQGLEQLAGGDSEVPPQRMPEARLVWSATRRQLAANPSDLASADRLVWLTMILRSTILSAKDEQGARALVEGALEVLMLPRQRQVMRGHLSRSATRMGDLDSAVRWLAGCDPFSEDLLADSSFRLSSAFLDTARGQPQNVLEMLGGNEQDVPVDDSMDALATVLRANAWEKMGRLDAAQAVLTAYMGRGGHGGTVEAVVRALPEAWNVCAQSFRPAQAEVRQVVAQRAASATGGSVIGWIVLGAGCIPLFILLGMSAGGMFNPAMLPMLIFPLVFGGIGWKMVSNAKRAKEIAQGGLRGRGRIVGMTPTGTRINNVPMMRIDLQVQVEGHPQVAASVNRLMYPQNLVGQEVPVIWHPKYPTEVVLEM